MESVESSAARPNQRRRRARTIQRAIERLDSEYGDTLYFIVEVTETDIIPHIDRDAPTDENRREQSDFTQACRRADQYFRTRGSLTTLLAVDSGRAEYMTMWCPGMKVIRITTPNQKFFVGVAHGGPVVPLVDAIFKACGVRMGGADVRAPRVIRRGTGR